MMEEYLVDLFLVTKVVGNGALLIRQLFEKKLEDVNILFIISILLMC